LVSDQLENQFVFGYSAMLQQNRTLENIDFPCNAIGPLGIIRMRSADGDSYIEHLTLNNTKLGDGGAAWLADSFYESQSPSLK
jgi:hypothetical protein